MTRLEVIHLRLAGPTTHCLVEDISRAIEDAGFPFRASIYRHAAVAGDLCIHLHLRPEDGELSMLGEQLSHALKEHGMVVHTLWIEEWGIDLLAPDI